MTASMRIRIANAADAPAVHAIYAPIVERTPISLETVAPSVAEMASRIVSRQPAYPWLVAESDDGIVGYACGGRFAARPGYDWSVEVSVYVHEAARGCGIGRSLYTKLFDILEWQRYRRLMAGIGLPNAASVGLHESMGFTPVGVYHKAGWKFGAWQDVGWWQRPLGDSDAPPEAPRPLTDVTGAPLAG
jgi:L-amino acid N-acyltransferase YncA